MSDNPKSKLAKLRSTVPLADIRDENESDEERIRRNALEFRGTKAGPEFADKPEEEGAIEGDLEDVVPYGSTLSMLTPLGGLKGAARHGAEEFAEHAPSLLGKLRGMLPREKLLKMGEEIRLGGKADLFDDGGKLIHTIGGHTDEGKALKQLAKEELGRAEAAAPTAFKSNQGTEMGGFSKKEKPEFIPRDRGPKGEAKEFMDKSDLGISPIRKTANQYLTEAQKARKKLEEEAMSRK